MTTPPPTLRRFLVTALPTGAAYFDISKDESIDLVGGVVLGVVEATSEKEAVRKAKRQAAEEHRAALLIDAYELA